MTTDHLCPLLDNTKDTNLLFTVAELLARRRIPGSVGQFLRQTDSVAQGWRGSAGHCGWRCDPQTQPSPNSWDQQ